MDKIGRAIQSVGSVVGLMLGFFPGLSIPVERGQRPNNPNPNRLKTVITIKIRILSEKAAAGCS